MTCGFLKLFLVAKATKGYNLPIFTPNSYILLLFYG